MNRRLLSSAKGLTLIELLLALSLIGVISVLIVGVLVGGMNSYRSVNKQISLHDEANIIMSQFSNEIFVATCVEPVPAVESEFEQKDPVTEIHIKKYGSPEEISLAFDVAKGEAKIKNNVIHSSMVIVAEESNFIVDKEKGTVLIDLTIKNQNEQRLQLKEEVTYVNVQ